MTSVKPGTKAHFVCSHWELRPSETANRRDVVVGLAQVEGGGGGGFDRCAITLVFEGDRIDAAPIVSLVIHSYWILSLASSSGWGQ